MIRIAVVNRGEAAMRALSGITESDGVDGCQFTSIALFTDPDTNSPFVRYADEAFYLGPALFFDEVEGRQKHSYLDLNRIKSVLVEARADAVWVGWGFLSENADFAAMCEDLGILFIGPTSEAMRRLSNKITAKQIAEACGVPVAPWSQGPVQDTETAIASAERIG